MAWSILNIFNRNPKRKKSTRTAAEFLAELAEDEEYQARMKKKEEARLAKVARLKKEAIPLVADLNAVGIQTDSVSILVNSPNNYDEAIPVLREHLDKNYSKEIREGIVRALTIPSAEGVVNDKLLTMFKETEDNGLRWVIGNALATVASKNDIGQLLGFLADSSYGEARSQLVHALARLQKAESIPVLIDYLQDKHMTAECATALGNLKAKQAKAALLQVKHDNSWVRQQVKAALKKIG